MQTLRRSATLCVLGTIGLVAITFACYRLHFNIAIAGFLYMIVVVLVSRVGDLVSSIFVSLFAVFCLADLAPPTHSFRVDDPLDIVAIITFLTASLVIVRLVSKLREMTQDALVSVHRKLIDAEEREYTRIAYELNEDINQRVALVALGLEQLGDLEHIPSESVAEVSGRSRELWQHVSEIDADLHAISHRLRSSNLEYFGIETAAKTFCRGFAAQRKVDIDFSSRDLPSHVPLEISFPLLRVLQEALLNSAKHSGTQHFEVELFGTSDVNHLAVCDRGVGFDPEAAVRGRGLGITSMRERLKLVNGEFSIESQAQHGTKIHASVPLI